VRLATQVHPPVEQPPAGALVQPLGRGCRGAAGCRAGCRAFSGKSIRAALQAGFERASGRGTTAGLAPVHPAVPKLALNSMVLTTARVRRDATSPWAGRTRAGGWSCWSTTATFACSAPKARCCASWCWIPAASTSRFASCCCLRCLATSVSDVLGHHKTEGEGFEPSSEENPLKRFSSPAHAGRIAHAYWAFRASRGPWGRNWEYGATAPRPGIARAWSADHTPRRSELYSLGLLKEPPSRVPFRNTVVRGECATADRSRALDILRRADLARP